MMKRTASMNAKLFGNCNYSQSTSDDCATRFTLNYHDRQKKLQQQQKALKFGDSLKILQHSLHEKIWKC